jgi:hypothetical protein
MLSFVIIPAPAKNLKISTFLNRLALANEAASHPIEGGSRAAGL